MFLRLRQVDERQPIYTKVNESALPVCEVYLALQRKNNPKTQTFSSF